MYKYMNYFCYFGQTKGYQGAVGKIKYDVSGLLYKILKNGKMK